MSLLSIRELADIWPKSYDSIIKMIRRERIKDVLWLTKQESTGKGLQWKEGGGGGKNGKRPFISIEDPAIPPEVKAEYFRQQLHDRTGPQDGPSYKPGQIPASSAPAPLSIDQSRPLSEGNKASEKSSDAFHLSISLGQGGDNAPSASHLSYPGQAKQIALARVDLIDHWLDYRKQTDLKKEEADKWFIDGYNTGKMIPHLYNVLGEVSRSKLYRWNAELDGSSDWTRLVPQWHKAKNKTPGLTKYEKKFFLNFLLTPNKLKIGTAYGYTKYALEKHGHPVSSSESTFRRYAEYFKKNRYDEWTLLREGQKALRDKVEPFIRRDPSILNVGDVFVADGHRLNFQIINPLNKGRPGRAVIVGYLDWKSYDLAGYEIMFEENTQCIASALRNSIIRLGRVPKVCYQDNGKAFKSRFFTGGDINLKTCGINGLFGRLGIVPVFATPYNARAKIIERWFKDFSDQFERLMPSFTGANINDKPAWMMRNEKFHKARHNGHIPTIEEVNGMIEAWLLYHRSKPCPHIKGKAKTIGEVWNEGAGGQGAGIRMDDLDDLMMAPEIRDIGQNGIRFLNSEYYDDSLYGLRERVLIKYSLFDLSHIKVYTIHGEPLCTARRVEPTHPMAVALGDANDIESVRRGVAQQRRLEKRTVTLAKQYLKDRGEAPQLDWQKVAETAPRVIEKIEQAGIPLPGEERQIPEEMIEKQSGRASDSEQTDPAPDTGDAPQIFEEAWQRYEYLMDMQESWSEEETAWLLEFRNSGEYYSIYESSGNEKERIDRISREGANKKEDQVFLANYKKVKQIELKDKEAVWR